MISFLREKIILSLEFLHLKIFGHEMGEEMRKFLGHLSWSFFGGIIAAGLLFALNILVGRLLGPIEYGKYGLIIAISSIFIIPMTMGIDTSIIYHVARSKSEADKDQNVASSLWMVACLIAISVLIVLIFSPFVARVFNAQNEILILALIFSIFLAIRNIADAIVRGFHFFKFQSIVKIAEALVVAILFFILIKTNNIVNIKPYIYAILAGYMFVILSVLWKKRSALSFDIKYSKTIFSYGTYAIIGSFFGIMTSSFDKILVNKYIGQEQLGIYNAYMMASFLLVSQLTMLFINVFFPYLASIEDNGSILKKLNRIAIIFFIPAFIVLCLIIWLAITLFGKQYPLDWWLVTEFSLFGIITMYFTSLWWLIASRSKRGIRFTSINGIIAGSIFLSLMFYFNSTLSLYKVVLFLIIALAYPLIVGSLYYGRIK